MSEDPLLRELGHLAREESDLARARLDERWDRLAAGTLTAEEEAELRALAAASPEAHEAYEAFRPLGEDFQRRMVDGISSEIEDRAPREEPRSRLLSFPRWPRAAWWTAATTAAAAAALLLLLRGPGPDTMAPLPTYVAELSGGTQTFRGEEGPSTGPRVYEPGDRFQVVLRPATETPGKGLEAECFLLRKGDLRPLEARFQVDPGGAVKIEGSIGRGLPSGDWTLWSVVGREGELPDPTDPRLFATAVEVRERDWVAVPKEIRIHSRSP
jgi:hypothetical protein